MRGAARAFNTTAHPVATQFPGHGFLDNLTIESSTVYFTCIFTYFVFYTSININIIALMRKLRGSSIFFANFLTRYPLVFVQPGTGRRPVNWCMY